MIAHIRNFAIIAHIDHGKTTLTDRILELAGVIERDSSHQRVMDSNPIEQERGITIKLAPVNFPYPLAGQTYQLNLIDTPGHVDFGYEVSRSLAACEGVMLVVDASQGVQAQTLTNYHQAQELGLKVVPVINKIDLPSADVERTMLEVMDLCQVKDSEIVCVSAKTGQNVDQVLTAVIERIPAPSGDINLSLRALLISSYVDSHQGAIGLVKVVDGEIFAKQRLVFCADGSWFGSQSVGLFKPAMTVCDKLKAGQVGYVATGLKDARLLKMGDTLTTFADREKIVRLPGYLEPIPMVYLEVYPIDATQLGLLSDSLYKLSLADAALQYTGTHSKALGNGFRIGFLGILHAEVALERLQREFDLDVIATPPSVTYLVKNKKGQQELISSPNQLADPSLIEWIKEPMVMAQIYTPEQYLNACLKLCRDRRGQLKSTQSFGSQMLILSQLPLAELITDFHDTLKSLTSGYASMTYKKVGFEVADVVRVDILLNLEQIDALSFLAVRAQAEYRGRRFVEKLKEILPRQQFTVPIQASIGGKVIARETLQSFRKDVTAKLYGGDVTRRKKLLAKQIKGKKRMKQFGKLQLDQDVFIQLLKQ
ncbi:MAG: translation elongation factor 4 [Patescibacteria group bacterium]|nr:translation elongation factor 4 [Patescibacteria group bacterium]